MKDAMNTVFGKSLETEAAEDVSKLSQNEWLSDFSLHSCIKSLIPNQSQTHYSILYPIPVNILSEIFKTESNVFLKVKEQNHNCIVPLNTGCHWATLLFMGKQKSIYYIDIEVYLDSFGNGPNKKTVDLLNINFFGWGKHHNKIKLQYDSYQCGI